MPEMKLVPFEVKSITNDFKKMPYGIETIKAPSVWDKGEQGEGVVIAVLDTGIDTFHPDLADRIIDGRNFTNEGNSDDIMDRNGHGTHVAGTICGERNDKGVIGVAPKSKLLIGKVLNRMGSGNYSDITRAIRWATKWRGRNGERVRVINMSLGGPIPDRRQYQAILDACAQGIMVVVASGNEGDGDESSLEYGYPALYNECITVAASNEENKLARFSSNSRQVDVIAPGVNILSTYPVGKYAILNGTSMATPHVSGALALIINIGEKHFERELTESEIYALLVSTCCSLGLKATSEGHGLVDLSSLNKKCKA